jgi:hypothetical protein
MKALTIWQPWASLIAIGAKPYEFRSWQPPRSLRGRKLAIHAGARQVRKAEIEDLIIRLRDPRDLSPCLRAETALPFLEKVMAGLLVKPAGGLLPDAEEPFRLPLSCIVAIVTVGQPKRGDECAAEFGDAAGNDSDRDGTFNWGWPMLDLQPVIPPIEARGAQGIWDWHGSAPEPATA